MKRRDFVKTMAPRRAWRSPRATSIGDLIAQSPSGRVLESKFKGLADIALLEAKTRRLHLRRHPLHAHHEQRRERHRRQPRRGRPRRVRVSRRRTRRWRRTRRRAWRPRRPRRRSGQAAARHGGRAAGFGVRVIHSGVWGFASSPIVTEDEIRRITRMATEVAKASAIAKKVDVRLAPVPAYTDYWSSPMTKDPSNDLAGREAGAGAEGRRHGAQEQGRAQRQRVRPARGRVEVLRVERRLLHRAGDLHDDAAVQRHGAQGRRDAHAQLPRRADDRRLGSRRSGRHDSRTPSASPPRRSSSAPRSRSTWG